MNRIMSINIFILSVGLLLTSFPPVCSEENDERGHKLPDCKNFVLVSTMDGNLAAYDLVSGLQCWSLIIDTKKFLSSSLSKLEIFEDGRRVFLVPSLDGFLYKYDPTHRVITPLPLTVDILISNSGYLDPSNIINGGKIKTIHGIHRFTGEVIYTCDINGCMNWKSTFPENMLIVEEIVQSINAINSNKAEKSWHFRVVELTIKVVFNKNASIFSNSNETALIPRTPPRINTFMDMCKISLLNGFVGMLNKTNNEFSWFFKTAAPIHDVWIVVDNIIHLLDPFEEESSEFFTYRDGAYSALLFLGVYEKQVYIKRSRKLQNFNMTSLAQNLMHLSVIAPICLNNVSGPQEQYINHTESGMDLILYNAEDYYVTDFGIFFIANLSIAENNTHCILNHTEFDTNEIDFAELLSSWFTVIVFIFIPILVLAIFLTYKLTKREMLVEIKATCSPILSENEDSKFISYSFSNEEFRSRFYQDFELISVLGKGGFGVVMDVKNKLDGRRYAVKRIRLHEKLDRINLDKVLREVKALAMLDHHGIVRYFQAWFEYPPSGWQEVKDKEYNIRDIISETEEQVDSSSKHSTHVKKYPKRVTSKPNILEKIHENPLQLCNSELYSENLLFEGSQFSAYSSSNVSCKDFSYSEENHSNDLSEHDKIRLSDNSKNSDDSDSFIQFESEYSNPLNEQNQPTEDTDDSDSFIQFENDDLDPLKSDINHPKEKYDDESGSDNKSSDESHNNKKHSGKFWKNSHSENSSFSDEENELTSLTSEKHLACYDKLKTLNKSLAYPLKSEDLNAVSSFIFYDETKLAINICDWEENIASITKNNLEVYIKWCICILCMMQSASYFTCDQAKRNLCFILSYINGYIQSSQSNKSAVELMQESSAKGCFTAYLYIQMQLCQHETLRDWLSEHSSSRDYSKVLKFFVEIVDAVDYLHACGLMHRDLKPSNIYFSMQGAIKIGDFGLATSSEIETEEGSSNQTSEIHTSDIGTELYMSPEQKLKEAYDQKTDIYSLGIIFFELLVPFKTASERIKVLLQARSFDFPEKFKMEFKDESQLVQLLLHDDPKKRPTTQEIKQHPILVNFMSTLK